MSFRTESQLVERFCELMIGNSSVWGDLIWNTEFNFGRGKPDLVATNSQKNIYAFEAKLSDWSKVINQAYRNTCFANYSIIILPQYLEANLPRHQDAIIKRGLGVCFVGSSYLSLPIKPKKIQPIQPLLSDAALKFIQGAQ